MYEALQARENIVKKLISAQVKQNNDKIELDKLKDGKKTMKSIFKSKAGKASSIDSLQTSLEGSDKELDDLKKVIHFLTIYHG